MVIAPGDDDYDSDEELRPELEDGKICFLLLLPPDMNEALFWKSQTHSANDGIYDYEWVFLEIPVKNCIVGMLYTCLYASSYM